MAQQDYDIAERLTSWNGVKIKLEQHGRKTKVHEGEIYWASVGQNIGSEIYGKNKQFTRPVIVYKKLSNSAFMAIPLTSQLKQGSWYVSFYQHGKLQTAVLSQVKIMSVKRLWNRIGRVDESDMESIKSAFIRLYS